jgi:hypothetical protein
VGGLLQRARLAEESEGAERGRRAREAKALGGTAFKEVRSLAEAKSGCLGAKVSHRVMLKCLLGGVYRAGCWPLRSTTPPPCSSSRRSPRRRWPATPTARSAFCHTALSWTLPWRCAHSVSLCLSLSSRLAALPAALHGGVGLPIQPRAAGR